MVRVVLDANVIVSAAFGGIPREAVLKAFRREVVISPLIKQEILSLPEELSGKLSSDRVFRLRRYLKILLYKAVLFQPSRHLSLCRDPKDDAYLSLCLAAEASYLITGDADLLSIPKQRLALAGLEKLSILTPKKFLSAI
ncbi:MAG TPA: putative toxin-antitoxin system toxin component, PIN family [Deltaproteobacteria bacterium]|nr:putative toxin-antitoxin system toxin component, PIN family [Deltaproteobacteria bacterium]